MRRYYALIFDICASAGLSRQLFAVSTIFAAAGGVARRQRARRAARYGARPIERCARFYAREHCTRMFSSPRRDASRSIQQNDDEGPGFL